MNSSSCNIIALHIQSRTHSQVKYKTNACNHPIFMATEVASYPSLEISQLKISY